MPGTAWARRGWCMGGAGFRERMPGLLDTARAKLPGGKASRMEAAPQRDHGLQEAHRPLQAGLRCLGLQREDLAGLKKGDARKAAIAAMIRAHTAVPNAWLAQELELGHISRVSHCLRNAPAEMLRKLEQCR